MAEAIELRESCSSAAFQAIAKVAPGQVGGVHENTKPQERCRSHLAQVAVHLIRSFVRLICRPAPLAERREPVSRLSHDCVSAAVHRVSSPVRGHLLHHLRPHFRGDAATEQNRVAVSDAPVDSAAILRKTGGKESQPQPPCLRPLGGFTTRPEMSATCWATWRATSTFTQTGSSAADGCTMHASPPRSWSCRSPWS